MTLRRGLPIALAALFALGAFSTWSRGKTPAPTPAMAPADCNPVRFEGKRFTECIAVPGRHRIGMRAKGVDGANFGGFDRLSRTVDVGQVAFAVNGEMYGTDGDPIGYYVEGGRRTVEVNRRSASGNFYLKPNGVFFGEADGGWRVMPTDDFVAQVDKRPSFGTQSGPMLLIGGKLHPQISPTGTSEKIRNAVGVDAAGRAHFVIAEEPVSFGLLARMMRDHAGTADALFLDGTVSSLWYPAGHRMDRGYPLGPLIVVTTVRKSAA